MNENIFTIIGRALVIIAVLAFVLILVLATNNFKFLWFLFLILSCEFVPAWETEVIKHDSNDKESNRDEIQK